MLKTFGRLLLVVGLMAGTLACYEPDPVVDLKVSPDGRYAAWVSQAGALAVMDLGPGENKIKIYSNYARAGLGWSPDSSRLAFVEQFPNRPMALWIIQPGQERPGQPLLHGTAWIASPLWISSDELTFLSDRDAQNVNVWRCGTQAPVRPSPWRVSGCDVTSQWTVPGRADTLLLEVVKDGGSELWLDDLASTQPQVVWRGEVLPEGQPRALVMDPQGGWAIWNAVRHNQWKLVRADLGALRMSGQWTLDASPQGMTLLGDGRLVYSLGGQLHWMRPDPAWFKRDSGRLGKHLLPCSAVQAWGREGLVTVAGQNLLVAAPQASDIDSAPYHASRMEDQVHLAVLLAENDHSGQALDLLRTMWDQSNPGSAQRYLAAMASGRIERMRGHWKKADRWMQEASGCAAPGSSQAQVAFRERLLLAAFHKQDWPLVRWLMMQPGGEQDIWPVRDWLLVLGTSSDRKLSRQWLRVGKDVRSGHPRQAAVELLRLWEAHEPTTHTLQGVQWLVDGELEPAGFGGRQDGKQDDLLFEQPAFQRTLLKAARCRLAQPQQVAQWRELLLSLWVRQGDMGSARQLVNEDLAAPVHGLDYAAMLNQFLFLDEQAQWVERTVRQVLLDPQIATRLPQLLTDPHDLGLFHLAQAKKALIEGNWKIARDNLDLVGEHLEAQNPEESCQLDFLALLFRTKVEEWHQRWPRVIAGYSRCLEMIGQQPGDWEAAAFELIFYKGLIQSGQQDPQQLTSYLRVLRGMGDPLVNPTYDPRTLWVILTNLKTLEVFGEGSWDAPYLKYSQGMCHSLLGNNLLALELFGQARSLEPPASLLQRILLEEAALRDSQGQHELAARLYGRLLALDLPVAASASAAVACVQSELACGRVVSLVDRLLEVQQLLGLDEPWSRWLWAQFGVEVTPALPVSPDEDPYVPSDEEAGQEDSGEVQ